MGTAASGTLFNPSSPYHETARDGVDYALRPDRCQPMHHFAQLSLQMARCPRVIDGLDRTKQNSSTSMA